jgi:hypothetical protein
MMRRRAFIGTSACAALLATLAVARTAPPSRTYDLSWKVTVDSIPAGIREAKVWVALPQELPEQQVSGLELTTQRRWKLVEDPTFHNRVALLVIPKPPAELSIAFKASVTREPVLEPRPAVLTGKERALFLRREALVSLSPRIRALADSVGGTNRSRYDYVLSTMVYDKTAPGWGHGDSERACDVHRGNCTDFHSLFMSLSRAEGVPAVFEMGYATLPEGETDHPGGYHCWAWFYDDFSQAWSPVDISEADQHPERADFLFGHLDAERVAFSRGRDVRVPGMHGKPLNYLPTGAYVEVDGVPFDGVSRTISYTVDASGAPSVH